MQFIWMNANMNYVIYYLSEWTSPIASPYLCLKTGEYLLSSIIPSDNTNYILNHADSRSYRNMSAGHEYNCILTRSHVYVSRL